MTWNKEPGARLLIAARRAGRVSLALRHPLPKVDEKTPGPAARARIISSLINL